MRTVISSPKELEILNASLVKHYLNNKIENYIHQDTMNGIEIDTNNYVNIKWFNEQIPNLFKNLNLGCCNGCGLPFELYVKNSKVLSNITADRQDNLKGHTIDNIKLLCTQCNCKKSNC